MEKATARKQDEKMKSKIQEDQGPFLLSCLPNAAYKAILFVVHYIFKYIILLCTLFCEFRRVYSFSTRKFGGGLTIDHLTRDLGNLSKLPRHMSFVINEDVEPDYCDVANLVVWTIAMGIPYISIYYRHGYLKESHEKLSQFIRSKLFRLVGAERFKAVDIVVKDCKSPYVNGVAYPKRFCVQLLSEDDGKADIVCAARSMAERLKEFRKEDIDIDKVGSHLSAVRGLPDPDLAVQFGQTRSLMGFLPWQTRLTEILHIPSLKNVTYEEYHEVLQRYSGCQQRFGK